MPFIILIITITTTPNGYVYNQYRNYLSRTLFKFSYTILHELCVLWGYKEVSHPPKLTEETKLIPLQKTQASLTQDSCTKFEYKDSGEVERIKTITLEVEF